MLAGQLDLSLGGQTLTCENAGVVLRSCEVSLSDVALEDDTGASAAIDRAAGCQHLQHGVKSLGERCGQAEKVLVTACAMQDETGASAILAEQLDASMGGRPQEHREVQGEESSAFQSVSADRQSALSPV